MPNSSKIRSSNSNPPTIGGGFIVARRSPNSSKLRLSPTPYEHASLRQAKAEADSLSQQHRAEFVVFRQAYAVMPEKK